MGSSRLPGKVIMDIEGKPMLERVITRCQKTMFPVLVLTSDRTKDTEVCLLALRLEVPWSIGSESNVLERFYYATFKYPSKYIVRITGDCPCVDPSLIKACVEKLIKEELDYCATPVHLDGLDVEVMRTDILRLAWEKAKIPYDKEHVTPWIIRNCKGTYLDIHGKLAAKLSVDGIEELERVRVVYRKYGDNFTWRDLCVG